MKSLAPIIYQFRSYKPLLNALTALIFGLACLLVTLSNEDFSEGWIGVAVCAVFGLFALYEFSQNRCVLRIDADGITETVGSRTLLNIPWRDFGLAEAFDKRATVRVRLMLQDGTIAAPEKAGWVKKDLLPGRDDEDPNNKYFMGKYGTNQQALAQEITDYANRVRTAN